MGGARAVSDSARAGHVSRPYLKVTKKLLPLERARGSEREGASGESEGAQPKWPTERLLGSERLELKKKQTKKREQKKIYIY